jgi:beta-glucanase (GH16 family)
MPLLRSNDTSNLTPRKGNRSPFRVITASAAALSIAALMLTGATAEAAPVAQAGRTALAPPTGPLIFSTNFPGTTLNTAVWDTCYPWMAQTGCTNFGNAQEQEWYLPSQVHVQNGQLALTAQQTPTAGLDKYGRPKTYACRSGMVTMFPGFQFQYGEVQVVARLPFGAGLWPAIWLLPSNFAWPPEIDIMEHYGTSPQLVATLHPAIGPQQQASIYFPQAATGWHTYTLYWTPSSISVYYDSALVGSTTTGIPQQPMYLLLDLANNQSGRGTCSGTMYVQSVNVWGAS